MGTEARGRQRPDRCGEESAGKRAGAGGPTAFTHLKTAGASLAEKGRRADLPKCGEGFAKPGEGKSKSLGRKFKAGGSEIQASFFRESGLFKGLRANPDCEPPFSPTRPSAAGAGARGRAKTRRPNASPQGLSRARVARAVPQSMPASLPASRPFWGTKSSYNTDLENRKQK